MEEMGLKDELKVKNRDGYLEKRAFIARVDERRDEMLRNKK